VPGRRPDRIYDLTLNRMSMKRPEVLPVARKALAEVSKIGEVSCCAAWIAERTHGGTVRWLSLYLCLCLSHSLHLSLSVSLSFSPSPSPYFSLSLSLYLSISLSLTLFTYGNFSVAISPNLCISFFLCVFISPYFSIYLSFYLFYLTLHPHVCRKQLCETSLPL